MINWLPILVLGHGDPGHWGTRWRLLLDSSCWTGRACPSPQCLLSVGVHLRSSAMYARYVQSFFHFSLLCLWLWPAHPLVSFEGSSPCPYCIHGCVHSAWVHAGRGKLLSIPQELLSPGMLKDWSDSKLVSPALWLYDFPKDLKFLHRKLTKG